jgi:ubiquinone/menaquinone biosynthesis C-methylase UbiE
MENVKKKEFQNSLDLTNDELENYIPDLFNGLWELGSMPEYVVELIRRNNIGKDKNVIDLGCGKGAVLVTLAQQFEIKGLGFDIVSKFIDEANEYANTLNVKKKVTFNKADITEIIHSVENQDIVIYGYDSEVLGDLEDTIEKLKKCIKNDGKIILEFMVSKTNTIDGVTETEMIDIIEKSNCQILDKIDWDLETLKLTNLKNTEIIQENVMNLIFQYPEKQEMFNEYVKNQIIECSEIENDFTCTTLLLANKN